MISLPTCEGGWEIIVADPAWRFSGNSEKKPGRNAMRHYPCMKFADIVAMPVREIAAEHALLLLWITVPFAHRADEVIRAWGFTTKSQLVWPKQRTATGYWAMNQHELLIIARRGQFPCKRPALFPTSIIPGSQRDHSRKPEWPQEIVDQRFPHMRKLELNARRPRKGWAVWGNETNKFSSVDAEEK